MNVKEAMDEADGMIDGDGTAHETSNLFLCATASACSGIAIGFFGCVLSSADRKKKANGGKHTAASKCQQISGIIGSFCFGLSSLVALAYGPIAMVTVVRAGSLLPANVFFSQLFGLRPLVRDDYLGTLVTICGVATFSLFEGKAPTAISVEEFERLVTANTSLFFTGVLLMTFAGAMSWLVLCRKRRQQADFEKALAVALVTGCSSAFMDVATKGWSAVLRDEGVGKAVTSALFWSSLQINVLFMVSMRIGIIYGCSQTDVLLFVPLNTVLNIFLSVLAGMVICQEALYVESWAGICLSSCTVLAGIVMLAAGPSTEEVTDSSLPAVPNWEVVSHSDGRGGGSQDSVTVSRIFHSIEEDEAQAQGVGDAELETAPLTICSCCALWWLATKSLAIARMNRLHVLSCKRSSEWLRLRHTLEQLEGVVETVETNGFIPATSSLRRMPSLPRSDRYGHGSDSDESSEEEESAQFTNTQD
eukprot:TRINITY_DN122309_c0_g1_i1.p1 TRINITY_DN122309_c0_g1~~TRINITY_DN122309_c0_g1_i1.p1  ORF type:complete len:476 (-),score=67.84 TRINITY_DN122309_c0_g1_i1:272-1699(-)